MREKTIFSKHIPLKEIDNADVLIHDIELFNKIVHTACRLKTAAKRSGKSERAKNSDGKIVDLRKKENKELRKKQPPTIHMQMKNRFSTNDYFTNSACRTADAAIKSQEELSKLYTDNKKDKHDAVKKKRDIKKERKLLIRNFPVIISGMTRSMIYFAFVHQRLIRTIKAGMLSGHGRMTICLSSSILILRLKRLNRLSILFRKNMSDSVLK